MPESDNEQHKDGAPKFDFVLAEADFDDITPSGLALRSYGIEGSRAGYEAYDYTDDNRVPNSDP